MEEKILVFHTLVFTIFGYFYIFSIVCAFDDYGNFQVKTDNFNTSNYISDYTLFHYDAVLEEYDRNSSNVNNEDESDSNSLTQKKKIDSDQSSSTVKEEEESDQNLTNFGKNIGTYGLSEEITEQILDIHYFDMVEKSDQSSSNLKSEEESDQNSSSVKSEDESDQNSSSAKREEESDQNSSNVKNEEESNKNSSTAKNEESDKKSTKLKRGVETYGLRKVIKEHILDLQNLHEVEEPDQYLSIVKSEESEQDSRIGKRESGTHELTDENKMRILELHNLYRSNATPPASDMNFVEWDEELETLAQLWADTCIFEHGKPEEGYSGGTYGQNLYWGLDPTGVLGVWLWYDERNYYNFRNHSCEEQKTCGHYYAMMWAATHKMGCAMRKCGYRYNLVCHYYPAVIANTQLYDVAKPCSQCLSNVSNSGILCYNNLCISKDQCERNPEACHNATCNLECQNCGKLDRLTCRCICADGWDSHDCSRVCSDAHDRCGKRPGYPTKASCALHQYTVANVLCRKMCRRCNPVMNNFTYGSNVCCNGMLCPKGQVLDLDNKPCRCKAQCPGSVCPLKDSSVMNKNSVSALAFVLLILYLLH